MLLLGLDVGTSSTKAIVLDDRGVVVASGTAEHPSSHPRPGWSEQDPRDWWRSSCRAVRQAVAALPAGARPSAIGLSGQMHGAVLLDRPTIESQGQRDDVVCPALLWNDQRTGSQCRWIEEHVGGRRALVRLVGNAALPGFTLPKWLWLREHEPALWARAAGLVMPKDYVRFRMTGRVGTDVGDGAGTLVLDVDARRWSDPATRLFGIDPALLPPVHESGAVVGRVTRWASEQLGVAEGTPVVAGSGDNQCGAIGAGVVETGLVLATLGTSGVVYAHADRPRRDLGHEGTPAGRVHTMCAADGSQATPGHWSITGCTLSAAGALAWARQSVFANAPYDALLAEAALAPPGCEGLVFLPYLTGERCPHPDAAASGAWIGLTARHERAHLVRAVLEGVAMTMAQILDIMRSIGIEASVCRLGGGGTRSALWRDILTASLNLPSQVMEAEEGPAAGAALLAGVGLGRWPTVPAACRDTVRVASQIDPIADLVRRYDAQRPVFDACYHALKQTMGTLATLRG